MRSERAEAWLSLVAFIAVASFGAAVIVLIGFLWSIIQAFALLGGTSVALIAGAS